jgi:hypothetical protein
VRPTVVSDPDWRFDFTPRRWIKPVLMVLVGMPFASVPVRIVVPKDRSILRSFDSGVVAVIERPDLLAVVEIERLVDVDEEAMAAPDPAANLETSRRRKRVLKVVGLYKVVAETVEMALMNLDILLERIPSMWVTALGALRSPEGAHNP